MFIPIWVFFGWFEGWNYQSGFSDCSVISMLHECRQTPAGVPRMLAPWWIDCVSVAILSFEAVTHRHVMTFYIRNDMSLHIHMIKCMGVRSCTNVFIVEAVALEALVLAYRPWNQIIPLVFCGLIELLGPMWPCSGYGILGWLDQHLLHSFPSQLCAKRKQGSK